MKVRKIAFIGLALAVAACGDSTAPGTPTRGVRLAFQSLVAAPLGPSLMRVGSIDGLSFAASSYMSGDTVIVVDGADTLKITQVKMTLEEIELEREDETVECELVENEDADDCEDYLAGPIYVELNLGGGPAQFTVPAVLGTYDSLEFKFDVAHEDDASHVAYRAAHPEMATISVKVIGLFNGTPFEFDLDVEIEKEVALTNPLVVDGTGTSFEVDIQFDVASWFVRADGSLINPAAVCALPNGCADRERIEFNMEEGVESHSDDS